MKNNDVKNNDVKNNDVKNNDVKYGIEIMGKPCLFCELPENLEIQAENEAAFAVFDGFPVSPGHCLIIPKRHVASYFDLTEQETVSIAELLRAMKTRIDEAFHPDGYNVGVNVGEAAGQTVFHVHVHLIPRYRGDLPEPKGGVRGVIPEKRAY